MDAKDQLKLLKAGFTIIRDHCEHISGINYKCYISKKTLAKSNWHVMEKGFGSVVAMTNRVKELRNDPMIVKD